MAGYSIEFMMTKLNGRLNIVFMLQSSPSGVQFGHYYDMTTQMSQERLQSTDFTYVHLDEEDCQCQR